MDLINQLGLYSSASVPDNQKDRLRVDGNSLVIAEDYGRLDDSCLAVDER